VYQVQLATLGIGYDPFEGQVLLIVGKLPVSSEISTNGLEPEAFSEPLEKEMKKL